MTRGRGAKSEIWKVESRKADRFIFAWIDAGIARVSGAIIHFRCIYSGPASVKTFLELFSIGKSQGKCGFLSANCGVGNFLLSSKIAAGNFFRQPINQSFGFLDGLYLPIGRSDAGTVFVFKTTVPDGCLFIGDGGTGRRSGGGV